jgi:hypothetical protein
MWNVNNDVIAQLFGEDPFYWPAVHANFFDAQTCQDVHWTKSAGPNAKGMWQRYGAMGIPLLHDNTATVLELKQWM